MAGHGVGASAEEAKLQMAMMEREKQHLRELALIEERIARQRIENLERMEKVAKQEMEVLAAMKFDSTGLLHESERHLKEKMEASLTFQKHREVGEAADLIMTGKIQKLYADRLRQEQLLGMKAALRTEEHAIEDKNRVLLQKWRKEDDEARAERHAQTEATRRLVVQEAQLNMEHVIKERTKQLAVEHEAKVIELERLRAMRLIHDQAQDEMGDAQRLKSHERSDTYFGSRTSHYDIENSSAVGNGGGTSRSGDSLPPPPPATVTSRVRPSLEGDSHERGSAHFPNSILAGKSTANTSLERINTTARGAPAAVSSFVATSTETQTRRTAPARTASSTLNREGADDDSSISSDAAFRNAIAILKAEGESSVTDNGAVSSTTRNKRTSATIQDPVTSTTAHAVHARGDSSRELSAAARSSVPAPRLKGVSPVTTEGSQRTSSLGIHSQVDSMSSRSRDSEEGALLNMSSTSSMQEARGSSPVDTGGDYFMRTGRAGDVNRLLRQEEDQERRLHEQEVRSASDEAVPHTDQKRPTEGGRVVGEARSGFSDTAKFRTGPEASEIAVTAQLKEMLSSNSSNTSSDVYGYAQYEQGGVEREVDEESTEEFEEFRTTTTTRNITTTRTSLQALETITDGAYR